MTTNTIFFNQVFDKKRLKVLISWVFKEFGEKEALRVVEELKTIGFHNATRAGLSIGLNDLRTPIQKSSLLLKAEFDMNICDRDFNGGRITATERNQRIVDTWHRVSETLRKQVVEHFSTYDQLNPVYIMALSGARGNFSQVRQLVGMRGLMADPQGQIISFPIRSNLREGLTLTEYFISCSGARKGLVDTALRTADTGYLTRRLVDVSHHIVIKKICCNTDKGIFVRSLKSENKLLLSLSDRLVGRVLAQNVEYSSNSNFTTDGLKPSQQKLADFGNKARQQSCQSLKPSESKDPGSNAARGLTTLLAQKNQEIDPILAFKIQTVKEQVMIRSPLTCALAHSVCQLCYGWSLSQGRLVSLGEAVGVIAAQSIGEPGTQLTMRTFHTGGVFSGDLLQEIRAPHSGKIEFSKAFQGLMIRTTDGRIAFLTKTSGEIILKSNASNISNISSNGKAEFCNHIEKENKETRLQFQALSLLFVRQAEYVTKNQLLAQISILGEEGNQPIKSRQTIFAELSGKVFETRGAVSSKKFVKNINKINKNVETTVFKDELVNTLKTRTLHSIQPEKSAKLGFFHILATQIAATFDASALLGETTVSSNNIKTLPFKELTLPPVGGSGLDFTDKKSLNQRSLKNNFWQDTFCFTPSFPRRGFGLLRNRVLNYDSLELGRKQFGKTSSARNYSKENENFNILTAKLPQKLGFQKYYPMQSGGLKNSRKIQSSSLTSSTLSLEKGNQQSSQTLQSKACYNPYTAQFFSSTHNKNVIIALLRREISKAKKVKFLNSTTSCNTFVNFKESEFYNQKQQNSNSFFLRTIAQEGDLVDSDYKKYLS